MMFFLFAFFMAVTALYAGGSLPGSEYLDRKITVFGKEISLTWLPEFLFSIPFGVVASQLPFLTTIFEQTVFGVFAAAWSYIWFQTGHGFVLGWGRPRSEEDDPNRSHFISPFVDWLARTIGIKKMQSDAISPTVDYCRLFMAVKGFLIGLPVAGIPLLILWPLAYEIGERMGSDRVREGLSGVAAAMVISLTWAVMQ